MHLKKEQFCWELIHYLCISLWCILSSCIQDVFTYQIYVVIYAAYIWLHTFLCVYFLNRRVKRSTCAVRKKEVIFPCCSFCLFFFPSKYVDVSFCDRFEELKSKVPIDEHLVQRQLLSDTYSRKLMSPNDFFSFYFERSLYTY